MRSRFRMFRLGSFGLLQVLALVLLASVVTAAAPGGQEQNTYIEFIFDSSLSMRDRINDGPSRMAVAKEVMRDLIGGLEDQPGLRIALRVYGSQAIDELACRDSKLLQPFGSVDEVRQSILQIVESLEPRGRTPIGYSLQLAANDFPMNPNDRNIIVLITDGKESCGIDPCAVSNELQSKGVIMKPYVVGFAMSAEEEATVRCIGEYYRATDRDSLSAALKSIMVKAVAPPSLEIEAYGGGVSVLDRTRIEILDSSGNRVFDGSPGSAQTMKVSLDEGVYTVTGYLTVGTDTVTASASGVALEKGVTTSVRLDFGSLTGSIRVSARASGRDVSDQISIEISQVGRPVQTSWEGMPPSTTLPVGEYSVKVTHRVYPSLSSERVVRVSPDKETAVDFDLGELPAQLEVTAEVMGRDVTAQCQLAVVRGGQVDEQYGLGNSVFRYKGGPGPVDLRVLHVGDVRTEKVVSGTVLSGGETTRVVIDLSDLLGVIRATVKAGDADVTADSRVHLDGQRATLDLPQRGAHKEAVVPGGFYGVKAFGQSGYESNTEEIDVVAGRVTTVELRLNMPGTLVLAPTAGGKEVSRERVSASVYLGQKTITSFGLVNGRLAATVDPGTYDIECSYPSVPEQARQVTGVSVGSGMTREVEVDFDPIGVLDVTVIAGGAPLDSAAVHVYQGEKQLGSLAATGRPGQFQAEVVEGEYALFVVPTIEEYREQWVSDVRIPAGGLVQKQVVLDLATRVRINAIMDDKPTSDVRLYLYEAGQRDDFTEIPESDRQKGTFERYVEAGTYDLLVSPTVSGFKDRWIEGLVIPEGTTLERRVQIGGSGLLQVRVMLDGQPSKQARLFVHEPGPADTYFEMPYLEDRGFYQIEVAEGTWDLEVAPEVSGVRTRWVEGLEVWGGETLTKDVSIGGKGTLRVTTLVNGSPDPNARVFVHSQSNSDEYYEMRAVDGDPGAFVLDIAEGTWDVEVMSLTGSIPDKWVKGLEIWGGEVLKKEVSLGGKGTLSVTTLVNGKLDARQRVFAHPQSNPDEYYEMKPVEGNPGRFTLQLSEGVWDLEVMSEIPTMPDRWAYGIEVPGGEVINKEISLGGTGILRVIPLVNGKPDPDSRVFVHPASDPADYREADQLEDRPGVFVIEAVEGLWDIEVMPGSGSASNKWVYGIEVKAGQVVTKEISMGGVGELRVRLVYQGRPYTAEVSVAAEDPTTYDYWWLDQVGEGLYAVELADGTYDVSVDTYDDDLGRQWLRGVEIVGGQTVEKAFVIADPGILRIRLMGNGENFSDAYVYLEDERGWFADLEWNDEGQYFEASVPAGTYRLVIEPFYDYQSMTYTGVAIKAGEVQQSRVTLKPAD